jgi:hypothetical protein
MAPCSLVEADQSYRCAYCLHNQGDEKNAHDKSGGDTGIGRTRWNLGTTAVRTSKTSVYLNETIWRYIPEGSYSPP